MRNCPRHRSERLCGVCKKCLRCCEIEHGKIGRFGWNKRRMERPDKIDLRLRRVS